MTARLGLAESQISVDLDPKHHHREITVEPGASDHKQAIFTIVSNNYLHFARTLLQSVREFHPDSEVFCVIVDTDMSYSAELCNEFSAISLDQLELPFGDIFKFQYNVLELNTAVKPWAFEYLMKYFDQVIYIDPDIRLYKRLSDVNALLDEEADIVLTPHLLAPIDDDDKPGELDIRRAGTYNFGFCALRTTDNSARFVKWWQSKLERECIIDMDRGIFVDQSWIDLVPGMFERVSILRHPGYNVAYWNLAQRKVVPARFNRWTVNGEPLVFFHYSGLNPLNPEPFSKHQNRFTLSNMGRTRKLVDEYVAHLLNNGAAKYSKVPYGYGRFDDGEPIGLHFAELYRNEPRLQEYLGDKPFARSDALFAPARTIDGQFVTWAMLTIWRLRPDLQSAFPLNTAESVWAYRVWFAHEGGNYFSERVAEWHRDKVLTEAQIKADSQPAQQLADGGSPPESSAETLPASVAAPSAAAATYERRVQTVVNLFYTMLHRFPERSAIDTYEPMMGRSFGYLKVWKAIAFSSEHRSIVGWWLQALRALLGAAKAPSHFSSVIAATAYTLGSPVQTTSPAANAGSHPDQNGLPASESAEPSGETLAPWHAVRMASATKISDHGGVYFEEGRNSEGHWVRPMSWFALSPKMAGARLEVSGSVPTSLLQQATGSGENSIAVYVSDRFLAESTSDFDGRFSISVDLPDTIGRYPILTILALDHFVPAAIGLGEDQRQLAFRLSRIAVGDEVVFDCDRDQPLRSFDQDLAPPGINLVGYIRAELGVGEAARGLAAAAAETDTAYALIDVGFQSPNRQNDNSALKAAVNEKQPIDLLFVNADQTPNTLQYLDDIGHTAEYRIGFWHWEQPVFPKKWRANFAGLDEIWVPTAFVHEAVSAVSPLPVVKIPDAVNFTIPKAPQRKKFGVPERCFAVLVMYDFHSYVFRKNPQAAVDAFRRAMQGRKEAVLVIKTINSKMHAKDYAKLKKDVVGLNVVFVDEFLTRTQVYELQACCDVLLSLHRAEGFGLAPAEMMFMGKPIIATGWSGNMDFMTPMNSYPVEYDLRPLKKALGPYDEGPLWAEPDIDHAAWCLTQIIEKNSDAKAKAKRGAADVRRLLSPKVVGAQVRERLNLIARMRGID